MVLFQEELGTLNRHGGWVEVGGAAFNGRWMQAVGGWKGAVLDGEQAWRVGGKGRCRF